MERILLVASAVGLCFTTAHMILCVVFDVYHLIYGDFLSTMMFAVSVCMNKQNEAAIQYMLLER